MFFVSISTGVSPPGTPIVTPAKLGVNQRLVNGDIIRIGITKRKGQMKYRSIGQGAELLDSDYYKAELVLASEAIVKETMAIKDADDYILVNDDNVEFYSVVDKNGINSWAHSALRVAGRAIPFVGAFTGPLAATVSRRHFGGDSKEKLTFVKLKNGKRALMIVQEGYSHLIRSKNKKSKNDIGEDDWKWIKQALDKNDIELV